MRCAASLALLLVWSQLAWAEGAANLDKQVERLVRDLDNDDYLVRERATEELIKLGKPVLGMLKKSLDGQPSFEVASHLQRVLDLYAQAERKEKFEQLIRILESGDANQRAKVEEELVAMGPGALAVVQDMVGQKKLDPAVAQRVGEMVVRATTRIQLMQIEVQLKEEVLKKRGN